MSQASERALFARSLSGDWQSRTDLYREFIHRNPRIRRMGAKYSSVDDFLHDCFTNVLRASHTFRKDHRLAERVEAVAAWTALERVRQREVNSSAAPNRFRLCAAVEADEPHPADRVDRYCPPRSGPEDSLSSRITAIVGEPQFQLIRSLATEKASWDSAATAYGKPVGAIGPIVVRTVDRLSRYFGAPPPLNDDLEPVFSDVSAGAAVAKHLDPLKPRGRVIPMQLDPAFYTVKPETRRIGLTVPPEVRTIALWDAARASAPPAEFLRKHLDECHYCADVLRSMLLMQQALLAGPKADFLFCPGASTLLRDPDVADEPFHRHLEECALCRDERMQALWGDKAPAGKPAAKAATGSRKKIVWAAAAAAILGAAAFGGYHYRSAATQAANQATVGTQGADSQQANGGANPSQPLESSNTKYAALATKVSMDDPRVLASVLPADQLTFIEARDDFRKGDIGNGMLIAEQLANQHNDPGAQMLFASLLYSKSASDGYRAMQKAEAMPPRNPYRCWATLQCALLAGDRAIVEREVQHLSSDPDLGPRAKNILARVQAIK